MDMEFVDELPPLQRETKWSNVVADVQANPGKWAKIGPFDKAKAPSSVATQINRGKVKGQAKGDWSAATRTEGDDVWLYVKYDVSVTEDNEEVGNVTGNDERQA